MMALRAETSDGRLEGQGRRKREEVYMALSKGAKEIQVAGSQGRFDDSSVERLAKFIAMKESLRCKTLDAALYHQSTWPRMIPEAREMLEAAFAICDGTFTEPRICSRCECEIDRDGCGCNPPSA